MYEQYTDKQIVEMLRPKLTKIMNGMDGMWNTALEHSEGGRNLIKLIATIYRSAYIRSQLGRSFIIGEKQANKKKAKELVNLFEVGDKVKFLGFNIKDEEALNNRRFFPPVNTIGEVVESGLIYCIVRWPKGITSGDGIWSCRNIYLKKVTEHWVTATKDNVKVGSKVKMIDEECHRNNSWCFPDVGTLGIVTELSYNKCEVQWPEGITIKPDRWWCSYKRLEVLLCE